MNYTNWYVVHTKPRQEIFAFENLQRQGFIAYFPQIAQFKRLSNRWQKSLVPLFPRYLFVQLKVGIDNFSPIRSTFGVVGLVTFGKQPAVMPESVVNLIQNQERQMEFTHESIPGWRKGDVLEFVDGPFSGLKGIFQKRESNERVTLLLKVIGQQDRFSVPINCLTLAV